MKGEKRKKKKETSFPSLLPVGRSHSTEKNQFRQGGGEKVGGKLPGSKKKKKKTCGHRLADRGKGKSKKAAIAAENEKGRGEKGGKETTSIAFKGVFSKCRQEKGGGERGRSMFAAKRGGGKSLSARFDPAKAERIASLTRGKKKESRTSNTEEEGRMVRAHSKEGRGGGQRNS